ncbi:MAG: hypothetical protein AB9897_01170 [Anaerolineaceae bacterium]
MMRNLITFQHLAKQDGKKLFPFGIYVRKDNPLPDVGEQVIVTSNSTGKKFAGEVTKVDPEKHTYDAVIDLTLEAEVEAEVQA